MKYALATAALVGAAVAVPATTTEAWEPYSTTTTTTTTQAWEPYTTTTTTTEAWEPYTTTTTTPYWSDVKSSSSSCSYVSTYTTTECGAATGAWDNCKAATKTTTLYADSCTWGSWTATTTPSWSAVPVKPTSSCTYTTVYTTTVCGASTSAWDNCKASVMTETKTTDTCTWAPVWSTMPAKASTTAASWSAMATTTAAPAVSTWAPVKISTFLGAADKKAVGMGAIAGALFLAAL